MHHRLAATTQRILDGGLDQEDVWNDRMDWQALSKAMMAFALSCDAPVCVTSRRDEQDLSYGPYLELMMAGKHADAVYELFC